MSLSAGTRLGPYEITEPLGAGGMGEVYRAHDSRLHRDVAIKTLPGSVAGDTDRLARFQREAQMLAALSHPHIAAIYGLEESGGVRALVMELVEGPTLAERIASGPIPVDEALAIARQIGEALEAAHEKGIVHRDLKPANIKVTADNRVKVLDFGLAKAFDPETASGGSGNLTHSPTLTLESTRAGVIMGTAGYMSPEQARGKPVDKRADIWSFGVVLLEMLTGKSIFEGDTVSDTLAAVLRADIDWKQLPATTPPKVRRLLQRCLERDPKRRLRDIGDAWLEIDLPDDPAAPAALAAAKSNGKWWLPWAAAAILGGAGIAWGLLHQPAVPPRSPVHWTYSQKDYFAVPTLSRDGSRMVVTEAIGNYPRLSLRMMDQTEGKTIPGTDGMYFAEFSPDGQWLASFLGTGEDSKLKKIGLTGGTAITIASMTAPSGLTWGDDDTIVYGSVQGLMRVAGSGGTAQVLLAPDKTKGELGFRTPHFLPGSRALLFAITTATSSQIAVLDLKAGSHRVVVNNGMDARYVSSGHLVYARGNTLFAAPFDAGRLAVSGPEAPVVEGLSLNGPNSTVAEYSFSDSGLLVYIDSASGTGGTTTLAWVDRQGQVQPLSDSELWGTGRLSPDGRRVVNEIYTSSAGDGKPGDLWVFELERHTKTRLTFLGDSSYPIWTPDGRHITFGATVAGKHGIYSVMADGSAKPELLLATDSTAVATSWSPDGKALLYQQTSPGKQPKLWVLSVSGGAAGTPAPLHESVAYEADAQVSPDGRWVAYVSSETGQNEAYIQPFPGPGGKERVSTQGGDSVRWSHDSRQLFYVTRTGQGALMTVDIQTKPQLHIGLPQTLARTLFGTTWDPAPDDKHLLVEMVAGGTQGGRRLQGISDWFEELRRRVPLRR
jgi:eukaryotic-like serine/threonine-protein kinase